MIQLKKLQQNQKHPEQDKKLNYFTGATYTRSQRRRKIAGTNDEGWALWDIGLLNLKTYFQMKKIFYEQAEQLKKNVEKAAQKSKETIRLIIELNSKHLGAAIDANKTMVDAIKEQLYIKDMDASMITNFKKTFGSTVELSEEVIDTIIDAHTRRIESIIDFNIRLIEILKEQEFTDNETIDKLLKLIQEKFDESVQLSINNMKKVIEVYNKHVNLALNFNKKFYGNINAQMDVMFSLQNKNIDSFNSWATEWWKQSAKEEARV